MRLFAPFAWLGLMHVARGGGLDEFAASRARQARHLAAQNKARENLAHTANSSQAEPVSTRDHVFIRAFRSVDTNNDGRVSYDEIIAGMLFTWKDEARLNAAMRALGLPSISEFMEEYDVDRDGHLDAHEMNNVLAPNKEPPKDPRHCPALVSKIESCPTHLVLRCSDYFRAAEGLCYSGHPSNVETCIMTESCDNVCKCIANVEAAMDKTAVMVIQGPDGQEMIYDPDQHQKRFLFLLFFVLVGVAALEWTGLILASVSIFSTPIPI
ncbi:hypothetical protein HGRIS_010927 [Hohenbuehelia grisea]|uniref:EF-hand domain-containing protein n=1 Tax=Hohenbuehelia grisea TaxID=104357 RepID=A0ABR3IYN4_9AGAR